MLKELEFIRSYYELSIKGEDIHLKKRASSNLDELKVKKVLKTLSMYKRQAMDLISNPYREYENIVAVDIVTNGLKPHEADIRRISIYGKDTEAVIEHSANEKELREVMADDSVLKIFHNSVFNVSCLRAKGYEVNSYTDIMIMAQVLQNNLDRDFSLKALAKDFLNLELDNTLQKSCDGEEVIVDNYSDYCLKGSRAIYELYLVFKSKIEELHLESVLRREVNALDAVVEISLNGVKFDYKGWSMVLEDMDAKAEEIREEVGMLLNRKELDLQSAVQIVEALRANGIEVRSTSDKDLSNHEHEAVVKIQKYRKLKKQISTFGERLRDAIDTDGRTRGSWNLIGTDTFRMACRNPTLQGMPGASKKYFVAEEGKIFIVSDYVNIELRILAEMTKDIELVEAFNAGEDLHTKTALAVLCRDQDEDISDLERNIGKIINFGLVYGMTSCGIKKKLEHVFGRDVAIKEAEDFRTRYFEKYPGVLKYQDRMLHNDFIETLGGRYWSEETSELDRGSIKRFNYPIQASGAEGLKESMSILIKHKLSHWKIVNIVHDEVVLEVPEQEAENAKKILEFSMVEGMRNLVKSVPIEVQTIISKVWSKD